jgi:Myosin-like coiled-coil protein
MRQSAQLFSSPSLHLTYLYYCSAKQAVEEIFDNVYVILWRSSFFFVLIFSNRVRERLKDVLRQYELREKHFDCVIRSKELEVLLSRARAEEQRGLVEQERRKAADNEAKASRCATQMNESFMKQSPSRLAS